MNRKIPMWVFFIALIIIAGAGYMQDKYSVNNREEILLE